MFSPIKPQDNSSSLRLNQRYASEPQEADSFTVHRLSTEDYYGLLLSLTTESFPKAQKIIIECLPAWLNVINSFDNHSRNQIVKALNAENPNFSLHITHVLMASISSMDTQSRQKLWQQTGSGLEDFLNNWKRESEILNTSGSTS